MVFSSLSFLAAFLPLALLLCWSAGALARGRFGWRPANMLILAASLGFYFWGEGLGVLWLFASIVVNAYGARILAARESPRWRKNWLAALITANLAFLGWFKYAGFAAATLSLIPGVAIIDPQIALPLGISFYTFQAMSYVVDVYKRDTKPSKSLVDFGCYVAMFPQLVAGPIIRYVDIVRQIETRVVDIDRIASGFRRFLCGLSKKVLIANSVGPLADSVWGVIHQGGGVQAQMAWIGALAYALQIYYDFSGYSDMAIGLGRMLGFDFKENFLHPYCARSVRDFWRRWHISLSSWFRDYLYIPLGGSRCGKFRASVNGLIVFGLCGLWHGAGAAFVLWGLWHGLFLMLERLLVADKRKKAHAAAPSPALSHFLISLLGRAYALAVVLFGWVLFRSETFADASLMFSSLAGMAEAAREARALWLDLNPKTIAALMIGTAFSFPIVPWLRARIAGSGIASSHGRAIWIIESLALTLLGLASLLFVAGGSYNPFLYFRF